MHALKSTDHKRQSGFALVVALSLMAFVLMLILSMSLLVQVETTNASRGLDQLRAKEAARLALMMAIGDLQKYAGADLIVTATADALGEPSVDYNLNAKHWAGLWTSDEDGGVQANPIWLVSGETPDPLVGAGTSSVAIFPATNEDAEVRVPLVPIIGQNGASSSYAYWLSDESVKARVNLDENSSSMTYLTTDSERQDIREAYQSFPAQDKIFDVLDPIQDTDTATFSRIFNRPQVRLVDPSIDAQDAYHNFTLVSQSVLSDMANGGLKQNLTGRTLAEMNNLLSKPDYLGGDYLSHYNIDPLTGNALENIGSADVPLSPQPRFNSGNELIRSTVADFYDYRTNQIDSSDDIAEPVRNIMPVISEVSFRLGAFHNHYTTQQKHLIRFHADVEFWNPYPFPIRMPVDADEDKDRCFIIMLVPSVIDETGTNTEQMILSIRNVDLAEELHTNLFDFDEDLGSGPSGGGLTKNTFNETVLQSWMEIEDVVLQPGEVYHATTGQTQGLARDLGGYVLKKGRANKEKAESYIPDIEHDYHKWSWHTYTTNTQNYPVLEPGHQIQIDLRIPENGVTLRIINYSSSLTNSTSPIYEDDTDNEWAKPVWELRNIYKVSNPPSLILRGDEYSRSTSGSYTMNNFNIGFHFRLADELVFGETPDASDLALRFDLRQPVWDYENPAVQEIVGIEEDPFKVSKLANLFDGTDLIDDASADTHAGHYERAFLYNAPMHEPLSVGALHRLPLSFETVEYDVDGDGTGELVQERIGTPWGGDLNQAFDKYFYTGAPAFDWTDNLPLGVAHLRPISKLSNSEVRQQDAAEHLLMAGGFNINSTSISAWEAMLSRTIYGWEYGATPIDLKNAFLNLAEGTDGASEAVGAIANEADFNTDNPVADGRLAMKQAIRRLSDTQINSLAESVVDALDIHFANNSLFSDLATFVSAGILDKAIIDSGINGRIARYSPAYISQNLILEMLAPYLAVRADTFTIKSYGTTKNPLTGEPIAEVICEATVQRLPQRFDGSTPRIQEEATTNGNTFGRRFEIVDIAWSSVN